VPFGGGTERQVHRGRAERHAQEVSQGKFHRDEMGGPHHCPRRAARAICVRKHFWVCGVHRFAVHVGSKCASCVEARNRMFKSSRNDRVMDVKTGR
jgi:hypothetical protein